VLNARERRAARDKQTRHQRQREQFPDAVAFAYYMDWPLNARFTVTWDACLHGDRNEGHILAKSDKERTEHLRNELRRALRKTGTPFACVWARDECKRRGLHIHFALHWPPPIEPLAWLLARLTGSPPEPVTTRRGVDAQSECAGWQIKRNTARREIPSALRWTTYLRDQGTRHLVVPKIEGKVLGVSNAIGARAIARHREGLEAWKRRVGWVEEAAA
jgi:hypothetical protein